MLRIRRHLSYANIVSTLCLILPVGGVSRPDLAAKLKASLRLRCPSDMDQEAGLCFETSVRDSASFNSALTTCARAQRRLPTPAELALVFEHSAAPQSQEWVSIRYATASQGVAMEMGQTAARVPYFDALDAGSIIHYRCVASPED